MLDDQKKIKLLEVNKPPCLDTLRGRATQLNSEKQTAIMEFDAVPEFCHSEAQIVQGGFITGMMDACMAHLLIALLDFKFNSGNDLLSCFSEGITLINEGQFPSTHE